MIKARFQITGEKEPIDTYDKYGFIYVSSDNIFAPPQKEFKRTTYAEENGEHIDPRANDDKFEYKTKFLVKPNRPDFGSNLVPNLAFDTNKPYQRVIPNQQKFSEQCYVWDCSELKDGDLVTISFKVSTTNITKEEATNLLVNAQVEGTFLGTLWEIEQGNGIYTKTFKMKGNAKKATVYVYSDNIKTLPLNVFILSNVMVCKGQEAKPHTLNLIEYPTANSLITQFNKDICSVDEKGIKTYKQITFFNDYKHIKIVGYPKPITESEMFWRDSSGMLADVAEVELTILVNNPSLCDFDTQASRTLKNQKQIPITNPL